MSEFNARQSLAATDPRILLNASRQPSVLPPRLIAAGRALGLATATVAGLGVASLAWGQCERRCPTVRHFSIPVPALRQGEELRILHISDLHLYSGQDFLVDFLDHVARTEDFDMVMSTGDNFGNATGASLLREAYRPLLAYPGVFVLGSNDYYTSSTFRPWTHYLRRDAHAVHDTSRLARLPWRNFVQELTRASWVDLSNRCDQLTVRLSHGDRSVAVNLAGVDDPHLERDRMPELPENWDDSDTIRIGVTHAPYRRVLDAFVDRGVDLICAGHTHGGQIGLPVWGALVTNCDLPPRYAKGVHTWRHEGASAPLHVSAGLGTSPWAPVRIATRPEVSILHLTGPEDVTETSEG